MRLGQIFGNVLSLPSRFLQLLVVFYRHCISPLKPRCCRFVPSCSEYALEALRMHGAMRGMILILWRLLRCHPFCHSDMYDPVPRKFWGSEYKD